MVLIDHREAIAGAEARSAQRARRAADPVVKLSPGPALLDERQRLPARSIGYPSSTRLKMRESSVVIGAFLLDVVTVPGAAACGPVRLAM